MKTLREFKQLVVVAHPDLVSIQCSFSKTINNHNGRKYTYLCPRKLAETLTAGDLVNVTKSKELGVNVACVALIDEFVDIDINTEFDYEWVIGKVDTTNVNELVKWQETAALHLQRQQRQHLQKQMLAEIGGVSNETLTLPGKVDNS